MAKRIPQLGTAVLIAAATLPFATPAASAAYPGAEGRIAFVRDGAIWTAAVDGSDQLELTHVGTAGQPVWSPDGERIAFAWQRRPRAETRYDIWTMAADGTDKRQVTAHPAFDSSPTWSPDGGWLAFSSDRDDIGRGNYDIYKIRPVANAVRTARRLTDVGGFESDGEPAWSPLGDVIAFRRASNPDQCSGCSSLEVWTVTPDSETETRLPIEHPRAHSPAWSPYGRRIAYTHGYQDDQGRYLFSNLYHVDAEGTDVRAVLEFANGSYQRAYTPAWSPDRGRRILYTYYADYEDGWVPSIWMIGSRGLGEPVQLIANGGDPDWQALPIGDA